jgi:hypothetical protein
LTFLDVLWAEAPFAGLGPFRAAVARIAGEWLGRGLLTEAEQDAIVAAAARADLSG